MIFKEPSEKEKLFNQIRTYIGEPATDYSKVVTDKILETNTELAVDNYITMLDTWLISQQWGQLQNQSIESTNFIEAFTTRTLDYEKIFFNAYMKQVASSYSAPWELKKDFIEISANTQVYMIPSGREINEVLWYTPAQISPSIIDPIGSNGWFSSANGWFYGSTPAMAMLPSFTMMLTSMDTLQKKKILQSELSYRVVGGPNGTKLLFLYPMPGSPDEITSRFGKHFQGTKVWYFYYDTNSLGRDKCLEENDDIIKLPSDVPIRAKTWDNLNNPSKNRVKMFAIAYTLKYLAIGWAKFSGEVFGPNEKKVTLDYKHFDEEAEKILTTNKEEIMKELESFSYNEQLNKKADAMDNLKRIITNSPVNPKAFIYR